MATVAPTTSGAVADDGAAPAARRRLWKHAAALLVLLVVLIPVVGTRSAFVTDESYVVIQLDTIEETGVWALDHPMPEVDPEGAAFGLHGATRYEPGYTLYGKHPALIYLYLPVHRAFGLVGLVGLSVLGTWAAALVAAALAERIRPDSGVFALWLVGVGSPLFFDAFVIHAHTIAAAVAGAGALLALRMVDDDRRALGAGVVVAALVVALLRTEGIFFAGALGGALGLFGLARRRIALVATGAATVVAGGAALLIDRAWAARVAAGDYVDVETFGREALSFVAGRYTSMLFTLFMPGYRGGALPEALTTLGAVLLIVGTALLRRRPADTGAVVLPLTGAALLLARAFLEWGPVPGLLVAFCVGVAALVLLGGAVWRAPATRLLLLVAGVYGVAVALTQYPLGGHTEWGGRYFALAVPLLGAVAAASLHGALPGFAVPTARALRGAFLVAAAGLAILSISTLRHAHDRNRERSDGVLAAAAELPLEDGERPIVVTEDDQIPRLARGRYGEARFLLVPREEVDRYLRRLARAGVEHLLLVSTKPDESLEEVPRSYAVEGDIVPHKLQYGDGGGLIHLRLVDP